MILKVLAYCGTFFIKIVEIREIYGIIIMRFYRYFWRDRYERC